MFNHSLLEYIFLHAKIKIIPTRVDTNDEWDTGVGITIIYQK